MGVEVEVAVAVGSGVALGAWVAVGESVLVGAGVAEGTAVGVGGRRVCVALAVGATQPDKTKTRKRMAETRATLTILTFKFVGCEGSFPHNQRILLSKMEFRGSGYSIGAGGTLGAGLIALRPFCHRWKTRHRK